ncbi:3-oxoadipate enol-lactone hydrolase [Frondihabitans sucicola]|uniref:3-oxoadipate enol-lactone hydrolase n=1 Tax=Frondihabitans sucicola TaxID=1268041 RepID=A0ABM8GHW7_9MICO|nr:alpha/beta hydrolase [Frondihabitans sucicola]BDZ47976.1 3-oxoadipate enol-lactone hydrolase [Frondihabitans sucicola]
MTDTVPLEHIERGAGNPLVLIMGLGAGADAWEAHIRSWSKRFRCIAVHNRGVSPSPNPAGPYSTAVMADDVADLIERMKLGRVTVVGISMGGAIAQHLALRHPNLVNGLVLTATWAETGPFSKAIFDALVDARQHLSEAAFTRLLQTIVWTPAGFERRLDELEAARTDPPSTTAESFASQVAACINHNTIDRLPDVAVPVLVTAGGQDRFVPLAESLRIQRDIPGADLDVFADSGHVHHWEELDRYNTLVERWITSKVTE